MAVVSNLKKSVKNIANFFGLAITKRSRSENNYKWLQEYNINTVLDIGANTGQFASFIAKHLPAATIHSFEPLSSAYNELRKKVPLLNLQTYRFGVGDSNGIKVINVNEFSPSSSLLDLGGLHRDNFNQTQILGSEEIQIHRLDDVEFSRPLKNEILIKIDVQGYEDKVIEGGTEVISASKIVILEASYRPLYQTERTFADHYRTMTELGFEYHGIFFEQIKSNVNGRPLYSDLIFVKK